MSSFDRVRWIIGPLMIFEGVLALNATDAYSIREEPVSFTNGTVVLRGTLMSPKPMTSQATLILVHGSGPAERDGFVFAPELVKAGISVLAYDKRGAGESSGDWTKASLDDLAMDALAAVDCIKSRSSVRRIGLWGGSQGGWIVPMVATRSTNVDFIISVSGAGVSPGEQVLYYQENKWRDDGISPAHIAQLRSAWKRFYDYISTGQGADALDADVAELEKVKFLDDRRPQKSTDIAPDSFYQKFGYGFDPLPYWEKVRCPVLAIWGEADMMVPARRSAELIQHGLNRGGNTGYTIKIFPKADHGISVPGKQRLATGWVDWQFARGYIETMVEWIKKQDTR